ncbi:hypothetical protein E8E11_001573 [Didymella keratinophila]|nr:hypothetical protein E8E11_001573 [Didymella keratinophila]
MTMPKPPQLLQIREEQWRSRIDSLNNYAVQHGYAVPTLTTWFPGSTIVTLTLSSLPMCQRAFYPGGIRIAVATNEAGEQAELLAVLANATKRGDKELQYIKRTPAGTVKISHKSIEHDAWSYDQWTDFVASADSDMERGSVRWHFKVRLMCFIALLLAGHYDGTVIVDGEPQATHREVQKSLFRTMQKHLGQRKTTVSSTQQPATDNLSATPSTLNENPSVRQAGSSKKDIANPNCTQSSLFEASTPTSSRKRALTFDTEGVQDMAQSQKRGRESSVFSAAASEMSDDDHAFTNLNNDIFTQACEASTLRADLAELKQTNTDLSDRNDHLEAQLKQCDDQKRNFKQMLIAANARSKEYCEKLEKTTTENLCLIRAKEDLTKQLDTLQDEKMDFFEALNAEAHKLREHNSVLGLHTNELREATWVLKKYATGLEIHIEKAQQKQIQQLESSLHLKDQDIDSWQQKTVELKHIIGDLQEDKHNVNNALVTAKEECSELRDELRCAMEKSQRLPEKVQATINNQRKMAVKQLAVIKDLRDELKELYSKHAQSSAATRTLQEERDRLTKQVAALQTKNEQSCTIIETQRTLQIENGRLKRDLKALQITRDESQATIDALRVREAASDSTNNDLNRAIETLQDQNTSLQTTTGDLRKTNETLNGCINELERTAEHHRRDRETHARDICVALQIVWKTHLVKQGFPTAEAERRALTRYANKFEKHLDRVPSIRDRVRQQQSG